MKHALEIAPGLRLPLEAITNTFAIFGIRGSGKSNLGAVMAEKIIEAGQPVCIIDPTGAWYGLKSSRDGKKPGLPVYVFGGEHADVPLEPTSGEVLANFAIENRVPMVLDLRLMRKHEQVKFVLTFAETLFHRNREPLMVMVDEVARFAPQNIKDRSPEAARCLGAMEDLATLGRNRGIGVTLIGQRPAPVSTTLRTQVENLICLRTVGKHDRKAIDEWVEAKGTQQERDEMMKDLASLPDGMGYFWSPAWLRKFVKVQFFQRETFDSGATPKIGQKAIIPRSFAEIDTQKLSAEIQATIERAKADDPKELKRKIAELQKQIAKPQPTVVDKAPAADSERLKKEFERGARSVKGELGKQIRDYQKVVAGQLYTVRDALSRAKEILSRAAEGIEKAASSIGDTVPRMPGLEEIIADASKFSPPSAPLARAATATAIAPRVPAPPRKPVASSNGDGPARLQKAERQILNVLAQFGETGRNKLALIAGYSSGGGGFGNALSSLRVSGFITGSDPLFITDAGLHALGEYDPLPTGRDLLAYWKQREGKAERSILECLAEAGPTIDRSALAEATGYAEAGGGFGNALSRLRTLGLISGSREITIAEELLG